MASSCGAGLYVWPFMSISCFVLLSQFLSLSIYSSASSSFVIAEEVLEIKSRVCAWSDSIPRQNPSGLPADDDVVHSQNNTVLCKGTGNCFGLWGKEEDGEIRVLKQGCWYHTGESKECTQDECRVTSPPSFARNRTTRFCCCRSDMCNTRFTENFTSAIFEPTDASLPLSYSLKYYKEEIVVIVLASLCFLAMVVAAGFLAFRVCTSNRKTGFHSIGLIEAPQQESTFDLDSLKLLQVIGHGRYSSVLRGSLDEQPVAVKIVPTAYRHYYLNERDVYRLPLMEHEALARLVTAEERLSPEGHHEYLLILDYYPQGCLNSFLSHNTCDWMTACKLAYSMTKGLAFLHTEVQQNDKYKPAIAHRDFSSRNVLVRADGSCVLADFGFAMRLTGQRPVRYGEDDAATLNEVGTVRYMAPEVLEGAMNLHDCESALKQVDVYALGLVFWEVYMRCHELFPGENVPEYQMPFQAEVGIQPTIEDMHVLVSHEKQRPLFPEAWKENSLAVRSLKETMDDCWDQDAEARLTAQCAEERIAELLLLWDRNRSVSPTVNTMGHLPSTATQNERNMVNTKRHPRLGVCPELSSAFIEESRAVPNGFQKNISENSGSFGTMSLSVFDDRAKNRNSINYERQQAQARGLSPDTSLTSLSASQTPVTAGPVHIGDIMEGMRSGTGPLQTSGIMQTTHPACLHLTEEDLLCNKMDPKEVDKNLKESSDENLTETSSKQFSGLDLLAGSAPGLFYPLFRFTAEAGSTLDLSLASSQTTSAGSLATEVTQPLPKQPNVPCRPNSLPVVGPGNDLPCNKCNLMQVETGVAKIEQQQSVEPQAVVFTTNSGVVGNGSSGANKDENVLSPPKQEDDAGDPPVVTSSAIGEVDMVAANVSVTPSMLVPRGNQPSSSPDGRPSSQHSSSDESQPLLKRSQMERSEELAKPAVQLNSNNSSNNNNNNNNKAAAGNADRRCHKARGSARPLSLEIDMAVTLVDEASVLGKDSWFIVLYTLWTFSYKALSIK
uniref:receptor protein serine/threonine kinase n=1 Tax=Eptatretus burgeri TaxID=7764 RepID=A0A8C4QTC1_EPTBU